MKQVLDFLLPSKVIADNVCLLQIGESELPLGAELQLKPDENCCELVGVLSGSLLLTDDQEIMLIGGGQAIYICKKTIFCAKQPCQYVWIKLGGKLTKQLMDDTYQYGDCFFPHAGQFITTLVTGLLQVSDYTDSIYNPCALSAAAYTLLMHLYRQSGKPQNNAYPQMIVDAISIMQQEYAYLDGIETLAERLFVTKSHFIRSFTSSVGVSPGKYLTHVRIEHAKRLLENGETSIEAVAGASGFSGAAYFGKVFRKYTGMTPSQYLALGIEIDKSQIIADIYL